MIECIYVMLFPMLHLPSLHVYVLQETRKGPSEFEGAAKSAKEGDEGECG